VATGEGGGGLRGTEVLQAACAVGQVERTWHIEIYWRNSGRQRGGFAIKQSDCMSKVVLRTFTGVVLLGKEENSSFRLLA